MTSTAHPLIAETAQNMAEALYEELARNNAWYVRNPDRRAFVVRLWPTLLAEARATLAQMLAGTYDEQLKAQIYDALSLDNDLRLGRTQPQLIRH